MKVPAAVPADLKPVARDKEIMPDHPETGTVFVRPIFNGLWNNCMAERTCI